MQHSSFRPLKVLPATVVAAVVLSGLVRAEDCPNPYDCIRNTCGAECQGSGDGVIALQMGEVIVGEADPCKACRKSCFKAYYDCILKGLNAALPGMVHVGDDASVLPERSILVLTQGTVSSGDTNADRVVDMSDALTIIEFLFLGGDAPAVVLVGGFDHMAAGARLTVDRKSLLVDGNARLSTGDANADGRMDISDVLVILNSLFASGPSSVNIVVGQVPVDPRNDEFHLPVDEFERVRN